MVLRRLSSKKVIIINMISHDRIMQFKSKIVFDRKKLLKYPEYIILQQWWDEMG